MGYGKPEINISFEKDYFHPGEELIGNVTMTTDKDVSARNITITFTGKSVTAWTDSSKDRDVRLHLGEKAKEIHVKVCREVWKAENEKNLLPAGTYNWNFAFEIPHGCPASFEGYYGFIRYFIKVNVDEPNWPDQCVRKAITVSPIIDLNLINGAGAPVNVQLENPVRFCCGYFFSFGRFKKGNVSFTLSCPTLGYVSGQTVTVNGLVDNGSTRIIESIQGSLHRMIIYREDLEKNSLGLFRPVKNQPDDMMNSQRQVFTLAMKEEICRLPPGSCQDVSFTFEIPPVVATIRNSKFISVEYFVRIVANVEGYSCSEATADMNIIVGNVPLGLEPSASPTLRCGDAAVRWRDDLAEDFALLFPYFGSQVEKLEKSSQSDVEV